ncbi:GNAT family N-acetyltransferase [Altererythrobacter sp. GH1-8]|uniref:GNAT family N-acetyltransferase n=1 Tax=Altererythrobacter sp. GH1-8 TaxID=3349333 RepID=UPI00374D087D
MEIRSEQLQDECAISAIITAAFLGAKHSGGDEAEIVEVLRKSGNLTVSLVAVLDNTVVGHAAFSPVSIDGHYRGWFGLGPVAVSPDRQGKGIGAALIQNGLQRLRQQKSLGCVVLGDPHYYARFGFVADPNFSLAGVPPEYFQRLAFSGQSNVGGRVQYHSAFGSS